MTLYSEYDWIAMSLVHVQVYVGFLHERQGPQLLSSTTGILPALDSNGLGNAALGNMTIP